MADAMIILFAILAAVGLKYHYSRASTDHLNWILAPTVESVELLSGITFERETHSGYINRAHRVIIAKSCAGINFLIIAFCMLIFSRVRQAKTVGAKIFLFIKSAIIAYLLTIMVNALRIITAMVLFESNIYGGWLTRERVHRIAGTALYFFFLCLLYLVMVRKPGKKMQTPLLWYLLVTLLVPLIRRLFAGNLSGFFEHSIVVILISMIILLLFLLFRSIARGVKRI